jgi:peroxiredoxin Q/BCP
LERTVKPPLNSRGAAMPRLKPGNAAPDFAGLTTDGSRVSLQDFRGRKLVLHFYPRDDTPCCTAQACSLRDHNREIEATAAAPRSK